MLSLVSAWQNVSDHYVGRREFEQIGEIVAGNAEAIGNLRAKGTDRLDSHIVENAAEHINLRLLIDERCPAGTAGRLSEQARQAEKAVDGLRERVARVERQCRHLEGAR